VSLASWMGGGTGQLAGDRQMVISQQDEKSRAIW